MCYRRLLFLSGWEQAARGPDNFDYALGMRISGEAVDLYSWKKDPSAEATAAGRRERGQLYAAHRDGVFHVRGYVAEGTQSSLRAYSRQAPFEEDGRNHDETEGRRTVGGGAAGFRVAARLRP
jgi:hypothetical protein